MYGSKYKNEIIYTRSKVKPEITIDNLGVMKRISFEIKLDQSH